METVKRSRGYQRLWGREEWMGRTQRICRAMKLFSIIQWWIHVIIHVCIGNGKGQLFVESMNQRMIKRVSTIQHLLNVATFATMCWTLLHIRQCYLLYVTSFKPSQQPCGIYVCVLSLRLCPNLCDTVDYSWPGSPVHGSLQARTLEWAAKLSSRGSSWPRDRNCVSWVSLHWQAGSLRLAPPGKPSQQLNSSIQSLSRVWPFATPWITARQASLSITSSRSLLLKLMSIESVMPSSHLVLCRPLLFLPPIPSSIRLDVYTNPHRASQVA